MKKKNMVLKKIMFHDSKLREFKKQLEIIEEEEAKKKIYIRNIVSKIEETFNNNYQFVIDKDKLFIRIPGYTKYSVGFNIHYVYTGIKRSDNVMIIDKLKTFLKKHNSDMQWIVDEAIRSGRCYIRFGSCEELTKFKIKKERG